jgi:hypothetical protein
MNDSPRKQSARASEPFERAEARRSQANGRVNELDPDRRRVSDWARDARATLERHPGILLVAGAGAAVAFGVLLYVRIKGQRRARQRAALLDLATRLLGPAYVAEHPAPRRSVFKDTLKEASGALATAAGRELGRRALRAVARDVAGSEQYE